MAQALPEIAYSDEEAMLAQSVGELLAARCDLASVRRALAAESGFDEDLYREMAALGWLGVAVPQAYGGAELSVGALASVFEPIGRHLLASPLLATTLASQALLVAGNESQKQLWLPRLVRGEAIGSVALSEPSGSYAYGPVQARATRTGAGFALSGTKTFVLDAENAAMVVAAVRLENRPALVLLEAPALAGRTRRERLIDETRRSARIELDGLVIEQTALLDHGDAAAALQHVQRVAWLLLAAEMAGGAEAVFQITLEYLRTRKQFGKPIGSYQALKHPMAEIACALEQGKSLLYHAATAFDREDPERELALRMAKAQLGDTFAHASDRAIQFHGAIGFTYECNVQLFFRRAQWAQYSFGDAVHHRRKIADLMWPHRTRA